MDERQLAEINANVCLILENQRTMFAVLDEIPTKKTLPSTRPPKSKPRSKEEKRKRKELKKKLSEFPTTQEVMDALGILSSNFYRNVYEKLLFPVNPIGKRPYYRREEVIDLAVSVVHESGAHTYSKLNKKRKG